MATKWQLQFFDSILLEKDGIKWLKTGNGWEEVKWHIFPLALKYVKVTRRALRLSFFMQNY